MIVWQQTSVKNIFIHPYIINPVVATILPISLEFQNQETYQVFTRILQVLMLKDNELAKIYYMDVVSSWDLIITELSKTIAPQYWLVFGEPKTSIYKNVIHIVHPQELRDHNKQHVYQTLLDFRIWLNTN